MKMKQKHLYKALWIGALAIMAGCLLLFESDQLWKVEERNLFLPTALFLSEQLAVPGGLLAWGGAWFTQLLYRPWLGVLALSAWWLILMALTKQAFRIPDRWAVLMLIPVAILLSANTSLGYWIYILKLKGHFFVPTIGTTVMAAMLWGVRCLPDKYFSRAICILITCAVGYPLLGIYALAATLLAGIWSWRLSSNRTEAVACSAAAILGVIAVPLLCYRFVFHHINLADIYWAGLPLFFTTEPYHSYYIPYCLLALFYLCLAVTWRPDRQPAPPMKKSRYQICQAAVAVMMAGSVYAFWMKDENFHRELAMQHHIERLDWEGVLKEAATQNDEPTRAVVMMRNLALSRIGRQGDDMFRYKNGSKAYAAPFPMRLTLVVGPLMYYQYGMLNYCHRLCIEKGVEFGFRTEDLKLLANCALLDGDKPLARKYIGLLKQTMYHSRWAAQAEALLNHPERIAGDPERAPITHMLHYDDTLGGDEGYTERTIMTLLAGSTYADDPVFLEQTLLATLWTKDTGQFWHHFKAYATLHPRGPIPRYYQEAAYLYGQIEGRKEIAAMPFDTSVKTGFGRFMSLASQYNNADIETVRQTLYPFFGDTYYYDYFVMNKLPEY